MTVWAAVSSLSQQSTADAAPSDSPSRDGLRPGAALRQSRFPTLHPFAHPAGSELARMILGYLVGKSSAMWIWGGDYRGYRRKNWGGYLGRVGKCCLGKLLPREGKEPPSSGHRAHVPGNDFSLRLPRVSWEGHPLEGALRRGLAPVPGCAGPKRNPAKLAGFLFSGWDGAGWSRCLSCTGSPRGRQ